MKDFLCSVAIFFVFYDVVQGYDANKSKWEQYLKKEKSLDSENAFKNIASDVVKSNSKSKESYFNNNLENDHSAAVSNQDISNAKCTSYPGKVVCQIGGYTFLINDSGEKLDTDTLERFTAMVYHRMMKDDSNFEIGINPVNKEVYSFVDKSMLNNDQPSYIECKPIGPANPGLPFSSKLGSSDTTYECEWKDNDKKMLVNVGEKGDVSAGNLILPHYQRETNLLRKRKRQVVVNAPQHSKDMTKTFGSNEKKFQYPNLNNEKVVKLEIGKATVDSEEKNLNPGVNSLSKCNEKETIDLTRNVADYQWVNNKEQEVLECGENTNRRIARSDVEEAKVWNRVLPLVDQRKQLALHGRELLMSKDAEVQELSNGKEPADEGQEQIVEYDRGNPDPGEEERMKSDIERQSDLADEENKSMHSEDEEAGRGEWCGHEEARAPEVGGDPQGRAARQCCPSTTSCPKASPTCCSPQTTPICCPTQTKAPCPRCRRQECPSTTKSCANRTTVCCPSPKLPICSPPTPPKSCGSSS